METKHKPATPLPFVDAEGVLIGSDGDIITSHGILCERDAAYIAHTANAYPEMVACLQVITGNHYESAQYARDYARALLRSLGEDQ